MPKSIWLTEIAGAVVEWPGNSPEMPMTLRFPIFCRLSLPKGPFGASGGPFEGQMAVFGPKRAAPFRPGWSMDAAGGSLRRPGCSRDGAGCSRRRGGTPVRSAGCLLPGAGRSLRRAGCSLPPPGARPISRREAPGAGRDHPGRKTGRLADKGRRRLRLGKPADKSVRAPLGAPLSLAQPGTVNCEPRTEPA